MDKLFSAVRDIAERSIWSKGVELSRSDAAVLVNKSDEEITVRVFARQQNRVFMVELYLDDSDWYCSCDTDLDACAHVVAAVIALKQGEQSGEGMAQTSQGLIGYQFSGCRGELQLRQIYLRDGTVVSLANALQAGERRALLTDHDKRIAGSLPPTGQAIPKGAMALVLRLTRGHKALYYSANKHGGGILEESTRVEIGQPMCGLVAELEDWGDSFRVRLKPDSTVQEVFSNGAMVQGGKIRRIADHPFGQALFTELRRGKIYTPSEVSTLVSEHLPLFQKHMRVAMKTHKLPNSLSLKPYLTLLTSANDSSGNGGGALVVQARVVYGEPVVATVIEDTLVTTDKTQIPLRDLRRERHLRNQAQEILGCAIDQAIVRQGVEAIDLATQLTAWSDVVPITGQAHLRYFKTAPLTLAFLGGSGEALGFELDSGASLSGPLSNNAKQQSGVSAQHVVDSWHRGESMLALEGGGFAPLPIDWLQQYGTTLEGVLAAKSLAAKATVGKDMGPKEIESTALKDGTLPSYLLFDLGRLAESVDKPLPERVKLLRDRLSSSSVQDCITVNATLRPYQKEGVEWLQTMQSTDIGALLADDMGLGKTLQVIAVLPKKTLIVAPTSVLPNWQSELQRFRPDLSVNLYHGAGRKLQPEADITLTSYALLRLDLDKLSQQWNAFVLDEAQMIKNPRSQVADAAYKVPAKWRVAMTGTPVENNLTDLWSIYHFLNPGFLGSLKKFQSGAVRAINSGDNFAALQLQERIRPLLLRRKKSEVLQELPEKTEVIRYVTLSEQERTLYDALKLSTREDVLAKIKNGMNAIGMLEALLRLRQSCCHPALVPGSDWQGHSSKMKLLGELLDEVHKNGNRAVVFSQWTSLLDKVEPVLGEQNISFCRLDGSTQNRGDVIARFQDSEGPTVILISLKAGGTGLNLTAADHLFLIDPWWNPAVEAQAIDRVHRFGQENPVLIQRLIAQNTIEEEIIKLQQSKAHLAQEIIETKSAKTGGNIGLKQEELLALLTAQ